MWTEAPRGGTSSLIWKTLLGEVFQSSTYGQRDGLNNAWAQQGSQKPLKFLGKMLVYFTQGTATACSWDKDEFVAVRKGRNGVILCLSKIA